VLIEKLLKFFIAEIDANLLEAIVVKDLKASNIQTTNVMNFLHRYINNGFIAFVNNESEDTLIDRSANTRDRAGSTGTGLSLRNPLSSDLELRLAKICDLK